MKEYHNYLQRILDEGEEKGDRTGDGTISKFGEFLSFDVSESFPLLTTRKIYWKGIIHELLWFIKGDTNIKYLVDRKVNIWNKDAFRFFKSKFGDITNDAGGEYTIQDFINDVTNGRVSGDYTWGDLGNVYGYQWRNFNGDFDQLNNVIDEIKTNKFSRRMLVNCWNPVDMYSKETALPCCHYDFQFNVDGSGNGLSLKFDMRSNDAALGYPFNIASYTTLLYMVAHITGLKPRKVCSSIGDAHIYKSHVESIKELLTRECNGLPKLVIKDRGQKSIDDFVFEDFEVLDYNPQAPIKMDMKT